MADTGWVSAGTGTNSTATGTVAWQNPDKITALDSDYSRANGSEDGGWYSNYLKATNFGFSIPAGAIIDGIEVRYHRRESSFIGTIEDSQIKIVKGDTIGTTNKSAGAIWIPGSTYTIDFGGSTDTWGETWTAEEINNSGFGAAISVYATPDDRTFATANIDLVQIKVYYTVTATTETKTIQSKARIEKTTVKSATAKARIKSTGRSVTASAKANIFIPVEKTQLVSPTDNTQDLVSPIVLVWELPDNEKDSTIHCHIQVDDTDNTFASLEHEQKSWEDQSNLEYFDGTDWQPYPSDGVNKIYAGNQARLTISLTDGEKFWRVRGRIG